jgi:hypothetical protein
MEVREFCRLLDWRGSPVKSSPVAAPFPASNFEEQCRKSFAGGLFLSRVGVQEGEGQLHQDSGGPFASPSVTSRLVLGVPEEPLNLQ